jgi:hypothetical protein
MLLEACSSSIGVVFDPAKVGVFFKQSPGHWRGEPELVQMPAQVTTSVRSGGEGGHERERTQQDHGDEEEIQNGTHGSNHPDKKIRPTVAEKSMWDKILP